VVTGKLVLSLLAVALLVPWPVAYAHDAGAGGQETVHITVSEPDARPGWKAFGKAIGSVTPGDIFYIDSTNSPVDRHLTLHLTNAGEMVHCYRYMVLNIGIYVLNGADQWEKAKTDPAGMRQEYYLSLRTGQISFMLQGDAQYKLTIDGGCFYCFMASDAGGISPELYLAVE
jgi:hypothetical protein